MTESGPVPPGPELPRPPSGAPVYLPAPYAQPDRWQPPPSRAMAGWALALAIVSCLFGITALVAIGLAIAVLVRSQDGRDHGKGLAIAALVVAGIWVVIFAIAFAMGVLQNIDPEAERDESGSVVEAVEIPTEDLRLGDCLDYPALAGQAPGGTDPDVTSSTVTARPCLELHDFEVYEITEMTGARLPEAEFPGREATVFLAQDICAKAFRPFVGVRYARSELNLSYMFPTSESWESVESRRITCLVGRQGTKTSGSLAGSRL